MLDVYVLISPINHQNNSTDRLILTFNNGEK